MQHRFTKAFAFVLVFILSTAGTASAGVTVFEKGDTNIKIGGLLQTWGTLTQDGNPAEDGLGVDAYIRRIRLMTYGQLNKKVNFFIETDLPNFGKDGDFSGRMFIQDAYLELNLSKYFQLDMGLLLAPFSHHGMQGATSLLGLDYHGALARYAPGSSLVWRDLGLMARGMFADGMIEYRVAVTSGVHGDASETMYTADSTTFTGLTDPRNPGDAPRVTARLTYNLFDAEGGPGAGGMFYDGLYLKKTDEGIVSTKKIVSFGASVDWQRQLNVILDAPNPSDPMGSNSTIDERSDYIAAAVDAFIDLPLDEARLMSLNGQVNFYYYDHGDRAEANHYYNLISDPNAYTGYGLMSELGFRYDAFQPVVIFDFYESTQAMGSMGDYTAVRGGLNYYLLGHRTTFKIDLGSTKKNGGDWGFQGTLQAQLLF